MEHDLLLMFVTGAGLWALGRLARVLPKGGLALATGPGLGVTRAPAGRVQAGLDVHGLTAPLSSAERGRPKDRGLGLAPSGPETV